MFNGFDVPCVIVVILELFFFGYLDGLLVTFILISRFSESSFLGKYPTRSKNALLSRVDHKVIIKKLPNAGSGKTVILSCLITCWSLKL